MFEKLRRTWGLVAVVTLVLMLAAPAVALADDGSGGIFSMFESVTVG